MKELKFNINYLLKRKELYIAIAVILLVNLVQIILCIHENVRLGTPLEKSFTAEYQFILYNSQIDISLLVVIAFPIALSLIFSDSSWLDQKSKTINILHNRLNERRNVLVRFLLSIVVSFIIAFVGFSINYILLRLIYSTGNNITKIQSLAFNLESSPGFFLDDLRVSNPVLFVFAINFTVSILLGVLSGFSYLMSFFIKHRIVIYFIPLLLVVITELLFPFIGIGRFSFIQMLQPFTKLTIVDYLLALSMLMMINVFLLVYILKEKDVLI